jgi:hypothetical protein
MKVSGFTFCAGCTPSEISSLLGTLNGTQPTGGGVRFQGKRQGATLARSRPGAS